MALTKEVREDAAQYNKEYDFFELHIYNRPQSENKTYSKYGRAYNAATKLIRSGKWCEIIGVSVDFNRENIFERTQLACC